MDTWLIVILVLIGLAVAIGIACQIPAKNRLIDVAGSKTPEKLRQKLAQGADPNVVGWFGLTALGTAITGQSLENVQLLLQHGADVHGVSGKQIHLSAAACTGNMEILEALLVAGADPNRAGADGQTPLQSGIESGHPDVVHRLLEAGADPDVTDAKGRPLLAVALVECHTKGDAEPHLTIVKSLLRAGANPNRRNPDDTPMLALAMTQPDALRIMLAHGVITDVEWNGIPLKEVIDEMIGGMVIVSDDDEEMEAAMKQAKATLDEAVALLADHSVTFKVGLPNSNDDLEHIWVDSIETFGDQFTGNLANDPHDLGELKFGDPVTFTRDQVTDWIATDAEGQAKGGFTVEILMRRQGQL